MSLNDFQTHSGGAGPHFGAKTLAVHLGSTKKQQQYSRSRDAE